MLLLRTEALYFDYANIASLRVVCSTNRKQEYYILKIKTTIKL